VFGFHENENPSKQIFVEDVVLDVIGMVLNKEGEQLQDEALQLNSAGVVLLRTISSCVGQQRT
jgi:hypothetical protein